MRSSVDNVVLGQALRQVDVGPRIAEPKLQDRHGGNIMAFAQRRYVGSNDAEVFGKKWQAAQFFPQFME